MATAIVDKRVQTIKEALTAVKINEEDATRYAIVLVQEAGCDHVEHLKVLTKDILRDLNITKIIHVNAILTLAGASVPALRRGSTFRWARPTAALIPPALIEEKKHDIFISHVKGTLGVVAGVMHEKLRKRFPDASIFLDTEKTFLLDDLSKIVSSAHCVIVLASDDYWRRPYCVAESVAAEKGKCKVLVVNVIMPNHTGFNYEAVNQGLTSRGTHYVRGLLDESAWAMLKERHINELDVEATLKQFVGYKGTEYHATGIETAREAEIAHVAKMLIDLVPSLAEKVLDEEDNDLASRRHRKSDPRHRGQLERAQRVLERFLADDTLWRFRLDEARDRFICARERLLVSLAKTSTGWFDLTLNDDHEETIWSANSGTITIASGNLEPVEGAQWSQVFPVTFGVWHFTRDRAIIKIKNSNDGRELRLGVVDFTYGAKDKDDSAEDDDAETDGSDNEHEENGTESGEEDNCNGKEGAPATKWRVKRTNRDDELCLCRRNLEIILSDSSNGWFEMKLNGESKRTIFSMQEGKTVTIAAGNLRPLDGSRFKAHIPKTFGTWYLRLSQGRLMVTNDKDHDMQLVLGESTFRYGPKLKLGENMDASTKWRFRVEGDTLRCRRKGLMVELPESTNGWFRMQANREKLKAVYSSENGRIPLAGNAFPDEGAGWNRLPPSTFGVWVFGTRGDILTVHHRQDGRLLTLGDEEFIYSSSGEVEVGDADSGDEAAHCKQQ